MMMGYFEEQNKSNQEPQKDMCLSLLALIVNLKEL